MRTEEGCKELRGTGGGNQQWPGVAGRKPRDPEDQILRKIHVGHLNADTDCAAMHSYFEKFGQWIDDTGSQKRKPMRTMDTASWYSRRQPWGTGCRKIGPIHLWGG